MADLAPPPGPPANRGPFARRLALKLVEDALGPVCARVIKVLVDHGTQQYGELARASGMPPLQLRAGLLVLVQHNYVDVYLKREPPTLRGPGPSYPLYAAALPRILQSLRVPRFLTHIADEHNGDSQEAVLLVRNLLENGRMRWDQLQEAVSREAAREEGGEEGGEGGEAPSPDKLLNIFRSLVLERYIERVPPCTLPPPANQVHPAARKKQAAPKPGSEEEQVLQRQQQEAAQRQAYQQVRFTLPDDLGTDAGASPQGDKPAAKRKRGKDGAAEAEPSKKRGRKKGGADAAADAGGSAGLGLGEEDDDPIAPVLWRVNYDEFNRRFRNDVLVETVKAKYGSGAGQAVGGLLLANARFEQSSHAHESVVLSVNEASSALRRAHGSNGAVPGDMAGKLLEVAEDDFGFLEHRGAGPGGEQFVVVIAKVLQMARLQEVQAVVRNKFGPHGMRIWRLLLLQGQLEQKQVADLAMVPKEEAREKLYAMLKAGYLQLQDVPRTADHAPSRTFYTWRANSDVAIARVASDLYRAAGNLHARLVHEIRRQQELLDELSQSGDRAPTVAERRKAEVAALKAVTSRLEAALLDLDAQICLFADV